MILLGPGCKLVGCEAAEAGVRPIVVVAGSRLFDDATSGWQAAGEMLVEALIAEPSVEAFDEAILHWLAGRDVMPFDAAILLPSQDGTERHLRAVAYGEVVS